MFSSNSRSARVLDIPELLDMIFSFLDDPSNASNASVSKRWSDIALDKLWRELDDLHRLFGILKPLEKTGEKRDGPYAFITPPDADDWQRLERYTRRVRHLEFQGDLGRPRLCPTVFEDVARTRTSLNILPNVNTLVWNAPLSLAAIFMHTNVKRFAISLPVFVAPDSPLPFFRDVVSRMPHLTSLDIRTHNPMHNMQDDMIYLLRSLHKLRKVIFPRFSVTAQVAETLQTLPDLGCIEFQYATEQGCGDPNDIELFRPTLKSGAFPSLCDLSLTCSIEDLTSFMGQASAPTNLTALYVDSKLMESPTVVHELLTALADTCQLLESLGILSVISTEDAPPALVDVPSAERISFSTLQPLQKFPNLTIFEIIHQYPLDLKLEDLEQLARSWPSLQKLILNNEPVVSDTSPLTLKALIPFAQHCPELQQLGLFINASTADLPSTYQVQLPSSYQSKPFAKLRQLSLGVSLLADEGPVALFLSQICPLHTYIECGITWDPPALGEEHDFYDAIMERCVKWAKVAELLPLLTKLRMEERERTRLLVAELQDLRMRSGVLLDRAVVQGAAVSGGDSCVMI